MFLRIPCLAFTNQDVARRFLQARLGLEVSTSNKSTLRTRPGSKVCATFVTAWGLIADDRVSAASSSGGISGMNQYQASDWFYGALRR